MHDPFTEKLSAYIDGDLSVAERADLDEHLAACDVCRTTLDELRDVVVVAAALRPTEPSQDLWPGIAERIQAAPASGGQAARGSVAGTISHRRFSLSVPQLAAAAVVLMTFSGGAVWMLGSGAGGGASAEIAAGTIVHAAGTDGSSGSTRLVESAAPARDADFDRDLAELERALQENRGSLDEATVEVIERSIESIDAAIRDAREALASDPGNPHLHRQLDSTMQKKLDVLRRATRAAS